MLETTWESRWLPDYIKSISRKTFTVYNWFLPVIRDWKCFWFLMTDKISVTKPILFCLYLENRIPKNLKVSKFANKRDRQDIRGKDKNKF